MKVIRIDSDASKFDVALFGTSQPLAGVASATLEAAFNCIGTAGTFGSAGSACGTFGTAGSIGSFGCSSI